MADTALKTAPGSGAQQSTDVPQIAPSPGFNGVRVNALQPGVTPVASASQAAGVQLQGSGSNLPSISLDLSTRTVTGSQPKAPVKAEPHHFSPVLIALPLLLVLIAAVFIWQFSRSAKNTTYY